LQLGQQESLNLSEVLLPSREEIINKKQREHFFWSLKAAPLKSIAERAPFLEKVRLEDEIFPENDRMLFDRSSKSKEEESGATAAVMRMVLEYEDSVREARLEKIKGWRKALALGAAGLAGLAPMKTHAHSAAFMFGAEKGAKAEYTANPELEAARAADNAGLGADDKDDFESGWMRAYSDHFGGSGAKSHGYPGEENKAANIEIVIKNAEQNLNAAWQALSPQEKATLQQDERDWITQKDAAKGLHKLQMIQDRTEYLQNKTSANGADLSAQINDAERTQQPTQAQSPDIETQIKDLRAQIDAKWNKLPANIKTQIKAAPDLQNYENAFNQAPRGSAAKLQALQKVFDYLDSQSKPEGELDLTAPTPTPAAQQPKQKTSTELNTDIMGKGYNQGKAYAPGSQLSPGEIRTIAATQAQAAGYTTTGNAQDSFIEGWIDGYYDGHNVPGDPERGSAQTVQPTPTPSPASTEADIISVFS
jgi:hypothetical protein